MLAMLFQYCTALFPHQAFSTLHALRTILLGLLPKTSPPLIHNWHPVIIAALRSSRQQSAHSISSTHPWLSPSQPQPSNGSPLFSWLFKSSSISHAPPWLGLCLEFAHERLCCTDRKCIGPIRVTLMEASPTPCPGASRKPHSCLPDPYYLECYQSRDAPPFHRSQVVV